MVVSGDQFKIMRRNSLRNEVDGSFDELEAVEDGEDVSNSITHQECVMLNRVLSDKTKLPAVCKPESSLAAGTSTSKESVRGSAGGGGIGGIVRRMTGAITSLDFSSKKALGGPVTEEECRILARYLAPSQGGLYLLPGACTNLLKGEDEKLAEEYERENAKVYAQLKKRNSMVARAGYPPTAC